MWLFKILGEQITIRQPLEIILKLKYLAVLKINSMLAYLLHKFIFLLEHTKLLQL